MVRQHIGVGRADHVLSWSVVAQVERVVLSATFATQLKRSVERRRKFQSCVSFVVGRKVVLAQLMINTNDLNQAKLCTGNLQVRVENPNSDMTGIDVYSSSLG